MGVRERFEAKNNNKSVNTSTTTNLGVRERYEKKKTKYNLESTIDFTTFENDLNSMGTTIQGIYDGWQTEETMKNTRSSIEAMQNRISAYQEYQKMFGGADLTELANSYKSILEDWDDRTNLYGLYKDGKSYDAAKKNVELSDLFRVKTGTDAETGEDTYRGLTYDEVQAKLKEYKVGSDEHNFLSTYTGYTDLNDFDKAIFALENTTIEKQIADLKAERDSLTAEYKANNPNERTGSKEAAIKRQKSPQAQRINEINNQILELEKSKETDYYNELKTKKNQWKLDNAFDYYKHYMDDKDFEEAAQYVTTAKEATSWWGATADLESGKMIKYGDEEYEFINDVNGARNNINAKYEEGNGGASTYETKGYHLLTEDEKKVYNALYKKDKANGTNLADTFLSDMEITLSKRVYDKSTDRWNEWADSGILASAALTVATFPSKMAGNLGEIAANVSETISGKEYNPYNPLRTAGHFANDTRQYISENIAEKANWNFAGENIPAFLYNTATNIGDSALGAAIFGKGHSVIMGAGAFQQKAKEMVEAGEDESTVFSTAFASGLAEVVFEHIGLDNLFKIKSLDSGKAIFYSILKQLGIEGLEEMGTEVANIASDSIIRGKNSELYKKYKDLMTRGYSESEIITELAKQVGNQVGWAGVGGALSGAAMGTGASVRAYGKTKSVGSVVRGNNRIDDLLGMAQLSPRESESYNLYTDYAVRNNSENITDAQLGSLYSTLDAEARKTLESKKSSAEQKANAQKTLSDLKAYSQDTSVKGLGKKAIKTLYGDEGAESIISEGLESGKDTESYKLATEYKAKVESGKKLTTDEITNLVDANQKAYKDEVRADAEKRLAELGENTEGGKVAEIIAKKSVGEQLSSSEVETLKNSEYGNLVYNELNNEELVDYTKSMDKEDAKLFLSTYDGSTDLEAFKNSFNLVTNYTQNKFTQDYILEHRGVLTPKQVGKIYKQKITLANYRQQKAIEDLKAKHKEKPFIYGKFDDSVINYGNTKVEGKVSWSSLGSDQKHAIELIGYLAVEKGMDVELITDGLERGINGAYEIRGNKILIDIYAGMEIKSALFENLILPTFSHELTHWMKEKVPELYRKYDEYVFETLMASGESEADILAARRKKMQDAHPGETITDEEVRDEVIARASEDMFGKSEYIKEFLDTLSNSEKKTFVDKVKEIFQKLKKWFETYVTNNLSGADEARAIRDNIDRIDGQIKLWDEMLVASIESNQALKNEGITGEELAKKLGKDTSNEKVQEMARDMDRYWYPKMTKTEVSYVERIAKRELNTTENYIDNGNKWLYNRTGDNTYFALYSTAHEDNPTVLYACKGKQAKFEHQFLIEHIGEEDDNGGSIDERAKGIDEILGSYGYDVSGQNVGNGNVVGKGSNIGNANAHIKDTGNKPNVAFLDCLRNIRETQEQNKVVKYSDRDTRYQNLQNEYRQLEQEVEALKNSDKYRGFLDAISTLQGEELDNAVKEYGKWTQESGLYAKSKRMSDIIGEQKDIRASIDNERKISRDEFMKSIENLTEKEKMDFVNKAVKTYGTTNKVSLASYLMLNGKMLDFSDGQGYRVQDHREISEILDMPESAEYSDGLIAFMNMGNIRLQTYGIDISQAPNQSQREALRDIIPRIMRENDEFSIDFSKINGYTDGSVTYPKGTATSKILADIDSYFKTGNVPEYNSSVAGFRYSDRDKAYMDAVNKGDMETAQRLVDEVARKNGYRIKGHHGTDVKFTIFDRTKTSSSNDFGQGFYFSSSEFEAEQYQKDDAFGDTYNKIDGIAYDNALERIRDMGEDANDDALFTRIYNEEFDKELKRRTDEGAVINAYLKMENPFVVSPSNWITEEEAIEIAKNTMYDDDVPNDIAISDWIHSIKAYAKQNDGKVDTHHFANNMGHAINLTNALLHQGKYDGILDYSIRTKFGSTSDYHAIALYSNKIKDSSPVTYDDNGNVIPLSERFNTANEDIRYSDRDYIAYDMTALLKESTIDKYLREYATPTTPNYAQAYITYMRPNDFLELTTSNVLNQMAIENETKEFNREEFEDYTSNQIPIKLVIDHESGEVITHEGRHRMVALSREGIHDVPVLLFDYGNKYNKENIDELKLIGQFNEFRTAIIRDAIPFSYANKDAVIEKFGTMSKRQKTNEKYGIRKTLQYSDRDNVSIYDALGQTEKLLKENENLKEDVERLKERLKLERQVTHGNYFNENQLDAVAGHLRNKVGSTIDKKELISLLKDVYSYIAHSPDLNWYDMFAQCYDIAKAMINESKPITETNDYAKMILRDINKSRISLNDSQKQEAKHRFGDKYRNAFMGKVIIANDGLPLDTKWKSWASEYPDFFDATITDADQITALYDVYGALKSASEMVVEYDVEEQTRYLAREIYNQYWNISPIRTTADKYDKQIKSLNFKHREAMKEFRDNYEEKLKTQHKADKEKYKELVKNIRERKDKEIAEVKKLGKERLDAYKENAERKTLIQGITGNALTLNKWLTTNSKDYHIHEAMKGPVIKLLQAIDFSSKKMLKTNIPTQRDISFAEAFADVKAMLLQADNMEVGLEELYGHDLAESIEMLVQASYNLVGDNNYVINQMSLQELQSLDNLVKSIKRVVAQLNKFHTVQHNKGAVNLANTFMEYGDKLGKLKKQDGKIAKFLKFRNATPYYFFKRLGEAGAKIFEAFQDGWDKLAFNTKTVIDYANATYTNKEVREWGKETKSFTLLQPNGSKRTFEMTTAQIMALHCVSKQEDALRHLLSSGMTLSRVDKKGNVVADYENISLTMNDLAEIVGTLTNRQKAVANKLQEFMNTVCAEWGNEISMARFAVKMFTTPNYFPIKVSPTTIPTDNTKEFDNASLFRLLNMSFTKARNKFAEQSIEIGDIFDIFAQHSSDMAKYNALALPVLDFNKFYQQKGKTEENKEYGVDNTLRTVFGEEAVGYLKRFVRDINGSQNVSRDIIGKTFFKNAKVASVANNLRVVLLQPTAYFKASAVMDNKYLVSAPLFSIAKLKRSIAKAEKYCGIIQWKSLGYYDTDISRGIKEKIKHSDTFKDKAVEFSLKGAEIADKITFGVIWNACELEIRNTRKDLKVGSEEFYQAVGKRLREIVYATQVVDSTMTRSDMMRSADSFDKMLTTFGSEPIIAYNMLMDMAMQYSLDKKAYGKEEARKRNGKKIRKVITAYIVTNAVAALVESGFDAFRDDDDEEEMNIEEFMKIYLKNFAMDLSIGNKLPVVKEAYSLIQGYSSSRMDTQWMEYLISAVTTWGKIFSGEGEGKGDKAIKDILKLASNISGYAFYNIYRDLMATLYKLEILEPEEIEDLFG